jgi:hypothetical protein
MAVYATVSDFVDYVDGYVAPAPPEPLERILVRAQRDVDRVLGPFTRRTDTGLKLDPATDLNVHERAALARAVCAQARYRMRLGLEELALPAPVVVEEQGPDFRVKYATSSSASAAAPTAGTGLLSPEVKLELEPLEWLRPRGARAGA